jgi:hypothetical protein
VLDPPNELGDALAPFTEAVKLEGVALPPALLLTERITFKVLVVATGAAIPTMVCEHVDVATVEDASVTMMSAVYAVLTVLVTYVPVVVLAVELAMLESPDQTKLYGALPPVATADQTI